MRVSLFILLFLFSILFNACNTDADEQVNNKCNTSINKIEMDTHTFSNYTKVFIKHTHLDIEVDFASKRVFGVVTHSIDNSCKQDSIILDTKYLDIQKITLDNGIEAKYNYGNFDELLGTPLVIFLDNDTKEISIEYSTTEKTEALDWLVAEQTNGKEFPFMYTQGQSIFTRSWIPIQDTPGCSQR